MQVVILTGGLGTRLMPLTLKVPKSMVIISGNPYLYYQLMYLKQFNLREVLLCVGYLGNSVRDCFGDGSRLGLNITYSIEDKPLGTAGCLKKAGQLLQDQFFLIYGDSFLPINYFNLESAFKRCRKLGLIVIYDNKENTSVKNNILIDTDSNIVKYDKTDGEKGLTHVDAGVLTFDKKILNLFPQKEEISLEKDIFPILIKQKQLFGYISPERFYDIGTFKGIKDFEGFLERTGKKIIVPES